MKANRFYIASKVREINGLAISMLPLLKVKDIDWEAVTGYVDCIDEALRQLDDEVYAEVE
ncbi:hypothetical protein [Gracilibacillus dipsosauri]|uniref:Uncharacterized protein n=1 Tax=Gracilibacillus dipsosauri TaxID=178340 RepID=A0A317KSW3_9BACI|nr:hypothetical protein [Gracilibacillus dipsosauri]PWU66547.1 hypothetical protein DLJ74_19170 [Gracilibacillus dipsosauri]